MNFYELNKIVILTFALYFVYSKLLINCIIVQICSNKLK